jgi:hypothetical protein
MTTINIDNPEILTCSVLIFQRHHGALFVEMRNIPLKRFQYIGFSHVWYFSGPTWWQDASIEVVAGSEKISFFEKIFFARTEGALIGFNLYRFYKSKPVVEIVAQEARLVEKSMVKSFM